jgi:class 3 adenylate cyclase/tetratricopeptide (TPR) repeat protein
MRCARCGGAITTFGCRCTAAQWSTSPSRCACCQSERPAGAKFCPECGAAYVSRAPIENERRLRESERRRQDVSAATELRQIAFIFCDIVNSTSLSLRLSTEDYARILTLYRGIVEVAVKEFGGAVEGHKGDGVLCFVGYPDAHEYAAERAIEAAFLARDLVTRNEFPYGVRLQVRLGVAVGTVVVGHFKNSDPNALGDAPNVATLVQKDACVNSVNVEDATRQLVGDLFEFSDLRSIAVDGAAPIKAWRVIGSRSVASRFEAKSNRAWVPMLGRDVERQVLVDLWRKATAGRGEVALVSGEGGIGKSRLAASLLEEASQKSCAVFRYFCSPYRQGSPLHPCIRQLEHSARFASTDSAEVKLEKLEVVLAGASDEDRALIGKLLNLPIVAGSNVLALGALAIRRRTMQALLALLEREAKKSPVLMVFEDAQWSDDTSRELLLLVLSRIERLPVMLLVLARPAFLGEWAERSQITRISLAPLAKHASRTLVQQVAGNRSLPADVIGEIVRRTDGIPLFLEEVTRAIVQEGETSVVASGRARSTLTMLLRDSLLPRLRGLGAARDVLETAAAIGRDFSIELLAAVVEPNGALESSLERLTESGLVLRRADAVTGYTFKHALIRDATHEIMTRDRRQALHARIADVLETRFPQAVTNQPEVLAWHLKEALCLEKAVARWLQAGRTAMLRSAMGEALGHLQQGIADIRTLEESPWRLQNELALTIAAGMAQIATQGYAVAGTGATFSKARNLCERLGDPPQLLSVLHGLWTHTLLRGEFSSAKIQARQILSRGEARGDPLWQLMGHRSSGVAHFPLGEFDDSARELEAGLALYDPARRAAYAATTVDDPRVVMLTYLSWSYMCSGRFGEAMARSRESVAEAREMGQVYTLAHALTGAAFVALTIDTPQVGLQRLDELNELLADNGIAYYEAVQTVFRGYCLAAMDRFDEARPLLKSGLAAYRATESIFYLSGFLRMAAEAYGRSRDFDTAMPMIEESMSIMQATDQRWDEADIFRVQGTLLHAMGDVGAAEKAFRHARSVAVKQRARLWELRASTSLAEVLREQGVSTSA